MDTRQSKIIPKNVPQGVWLWQLPDGKFLCDNDGNHLSLNGWNGDLDAAAKMRKAAAYHGFPEGRPVFAPGRQQVSQSTYEDQMEAMLEGEDIPGDVH